MQTKTGAIVLMVLIIGLMTGYSSTGSVTKDEEDALMKSVCPALAVDG